MGEIHVPPRRVAQVLALAILVLAGASTVGQISKLYFGHPYVFGLVDKFALDGEGNIPAWYSSMTLLACSVLLGSIAATRRARADLWWPHWAGLCAIFLYLSVDEGAVIHELTINPLRERFDLGGFFRWAWVVPGMVLVAVLGVVYARFVRALPRATRRLFIAAGALFVGGALAVEMVSGWWFDEYGRNNPVYVLLWTTEETFEMTGVAVFLYALLRYLSEEVGAVSLSFRMPEPLRAARQGASARPSSIEAPVTQASPAQAPSSPAVR